LPVAGRLITAGAMVLGLVVFERGDLVAVLNLKNMSVSKRLGVAMISPRQGEINYSQRRNNILHKGTYV
jgi:hypothetical protein